MDLAELINTYRAPLVGLIASWGAPWADAAEIAQGSLAEAYMHRASCRGDWSNPDVFGRWLRGVARNVYRNWARAHRRSLRMVKFDSAAVERAVDPPTPEPSRQIQRLRQAIEQLPVHQRQVVLMHYRPNESRATLHRSMKPHFRPSVGGNGKSPRAGPRRLLAVDIAGEQDPYILASALRVGLVQVDQLGQLKNYDARRHALVDDTDQVADAQPILSLAQEEWIIRASALRDDLTPRDRDQLEKRLHATLESLAESQYVDVGTVSGQA